VFPLSGAVLFPAAVLPLHVFELRYRAMVRDALSGERLIVLALLKPGWERDDYSSPEFFPVGCLARFEEVEWLPDDCYDLKVLGLSRVHIGRVTREYPYRTVRVSLMPQEPFSEDDPLVELERRALIEAYLRAAKRMVPEERRSGRPGSTGAPAPGTRFETLVNSICMALAVEADAKLALLEMDNVIERSRRAREMIESWLHRPAGGRSSAGDQN
jgi:hypothetical protein